MFPNDNDNTAMSGSHNNSANQDAAVQQLHENNKLMASIAHDYLKEKRRARRWRVIKFLFILAFIGFVIYSAFNNKPEVRPVTSHTALVDYDGMIGPDMQYTDGLMDSLDRAFKAAQSKGVILRLNSPGGLPVQAALVYEHINRLRESNPDKPIYVVATDICASGCYYIAAAADEIYAHPSSMIGSIGVILSSFGFVDAIDKLGVERRVMTAGESKAMLDPFSPVDDEQKQHVQKMLDEVHEQFIYAVKQGRGDRLADDPEIFSGLFWSGQRAQELGLVDGFGSAQTVAKDIIGESNIVDYTYQPNWYEQLYGEFVIKVGEAIKQVFLKESVSLH